MDTRLRVGRAIGKSESEVAFAMMSQLKHRGHIHHPPAMATDGNGSYREALVETWGKPPEYSGRGRRPQRKQPQDGWQYIQVVKHYQGHRLEGVRTRVVYGDEEQVREVLGEHTAYVERTHLTSRHMNGRLVRKALSFSKNLQMLEASCAWVDWVYNLTRPVKTLREEVKEGRRRWRPRSPAMAAGLTDHIWTIEELLRTVVVPKAVNTG